MLLMPNAGKYKWLLQEKDSIQVNDETISVSEVYKKTGAELVSNGIVGQESLFPKLRLCQILR